MNNDLSRAPQFSAFRRALVLAGGTVLLATSCNSTPDYGAQGNVFVPGQPRYGYGSPQNQQGEAGRSRANPRTTDTTLYAKPDPRKPVTIKRDPNNTTVDLSPPQSKPEKKDPAGSGTDERPSDVSPPPAEVTDTPAPVTKPETKTEETKPAVTREDLPFGQPVVGKKGYVYSPWAPDKGQVDVDGIPAGTKVKCPYTGKTFRVP